MQSENCKLSTASSYILSILRIVASSLFILHGTGKLFHFPLLPGLENVALFSLVGAAAIMEMVGGTLLLLGLFTRPVAFVLSGEMAFAYFIGHAPAGIFPHLNGGEPAILYCFLYLYMAAAGGGRWSLDVIRSRLAHRA